MSPGRWNAPIAASADNCQQGPASTTRAKMTIDGAPDVMNRQQFVNLKQFVGFHALDKTLAHMGKRPNTFQTFIQKSRFDILMDYFDGDVTHSLLDDDESDSENMTSNVTVVNNCKKGHDAIDVTLKKHTSQTSLRQRIDDQLGLR